MKMALIQMAVTENKRVNIEHAAALLKQAKAGGADMAVLPEMFCCPYDNASFVKNAEEKGGDVYEALSKAARETGLFVVGGSFPEKDGERLYNTSFVFAPDGREIARHRKMHLFDIDIEGGQRFCESDTFSAGGSLTLFDTPFGRFGLCICFDIRFQEIFRLMALEGAQAVIVPAAFNMTTGPAHWELLFRQRAVDSQLYTVGVSAARDEKASYVAYGNSIVCDPWGRVLCRADASEEILFFEPDFDYVASIRRQLPILSARREDVYRLTKAK